MIYYSDRSVKVTSTGIQVDGEVYRFSQLSRIWHRRDQRSWRAVAGRGFWSLTSISPLIAAVIGVVIATQLDVSAGARAAVVVAAILVGLAAGPLMDPILGKLDGSFDRGVYLHEIWVEQDGEEVLVLQTRDASRFGRIYRAVQRAAES
jgi:hypothetical protein